MREGEREKIRGEGRTPFYLCHFLFYYYPYTLEGNKLYVLHLAFLSLVLFLQLFSLIGQPGHICGLLDSSNVRCLG